MSDAESPLEGRHKRFGSVAICARRTWCWGAGSGL